MCNKIHCLTIVVVLFEESKEKQLISGLIYYGGDGESIFRCLIMDKCRGSVTD